MNSFFFSLSFLFLIIIGLIAANCFRSIFDDLSLYTILLKPLQSLSIVCIYLHFIRIFIVLSSYFFVLICSFHYHYSYLVKIVIIIYFFAALVFFVFSEKMREIEIEKER